MEVLENIRHFEETMENIRRFEEIMKLIEQYPVEASKSAIQEEPWKYYDSNEVGSNFFN